MRRLRVLGAVAMLVLLGAGCGREVGRYVTFNDVCRLDTMTGEVVCPGSEPMTTRLLIPAGPHEETLAEKEETSPLY